MAQTNALFSNPEEHPGYYLWQSSMRWHKVMNQELQKLSLTYTQYIILFTINRLNETSSSITQVSIASVCCIDTMMVSKVLKTLVNKKLVSRKESPNDTRAKLVSLTSTGTSLLTQAMVSIELVDEQFFDALGNFSDSFYNALELLSDQ